MATVYTAAATGQPFLDLMPINTSFPEYQHHHTTVGSAPVSPPVSPCSSLARPPTPGFGPLSSHPATPVNGGSYFPPPPPSYKSYGSPKSSSESASTKSINQRRDSVLHLPASPASQKCQTPPPQLRRRDSAGVKRLLSLATLRKSFMGGNNSTGNSTISLPLSRTPTVSYDNAYTTFPINSQSRRPSSPSLSSSTTNSSLNAPQVIHAYIPAPQPRTVPVPQLRKRKSASWFRRKSGLFMMDNDFKEQGNQTESAPSRPATAMGFERMLSPAPVLPDVGSLRGGRLTDGAFAGEDIFGGGR